MASIKDLPLFIKDHKAKLEQLLQELNHAEVNG